MQALFTHHKFITGELPVYEYVGGKGVYKTGPVVRGAKKIREVFSSTNYHCIYEGKNFMAQWDGHPSSRMWQVSIYAANRAVAHRLAAKFRAFDKDDEDIPADHVQTTFWHYSESGGARQTVRQLYAPEWADISRNYPGSSRSNLDRLVNLSPDELNGKIVLLHGPPGTGKTTFLITLGKAWSKWCRTDIVIDPEALFHVPDYMITAFLNTPSSIFEDDEDEMAPAEKWRMIVLEDTDELISSDAHAKSGQAMSRLLNLTDGMLGKGAKLILALTTNEDISKLHPALIRPGRCLMNVNVPRFPHLEARHWLGESVPAVGDLSLAEMYELKNGSDNNTAKDSDSPGQYL